MSMEQVAMLTEQTCMAFTVHQRDSTAKTVLGRLPSTTVIGSLSVTSERSPLLSQHPSKAIASSHLIIKPSRRSCNTHERALPNATKSKVKNPKNVNPRIRELKGWNGKCKTEHRPSSTQNVRPTFLVQVQNPMLKIFISK